VVRIGPVDLPNPVVVAPMSGITDRPFRRIAAEMGAGLLCTEMASAVALVRQGPSTCELTRVWPDEHPISVQLMAREPEIMAQAAEIAVQEGADIVDINMGCPVDKVAKKTCAGAGLARDIPLAVECARQMIAAIGPVPLTVKMRLGWDDSTRNCVELAKGLEQVGVADELYERPVNLFVATFVGRANVFRGRAARDLGGEPTPDGQVLVVRPERLHFGASGLPGVVRELRYTGPATFFLVEGEDGERFEVLAQPDAARIDERVHVAATRVIVLPEPGPRR